MPRLSHAHDAAPSRGILGLIERLGNKLPDPVFLFVGATLLVMIASAAASSMGWAVVPQRPRPVMEQVTDASGATVERIKHDASGRPEIRLEPAGEKIRPRSLLTADGAYWLVANMVRNFMNFPPLGVVLVCMFGIGVAERVGLFGATMKWIASLVPSRLLTPTVVFLGILSHLAGDAGNIVLPPLAGALFALFKRPPLAGIAAAFAGIASGFSANIIVGPTDALVAGITETGVRVLDSQRSVLATCNWWFMAGSSVILTLTAWAVTAWVIEPRLRSLATVTHTETASDRAVSATEAKGLRWALAGLALTLLLVGTMLFVPRAPLHGRMPAPAQANGELPSTRPVPPAMFSSGDGRFDSSGGSWHAPIAGTATLGKGFTVEAQGEDDRGSRVRGRFRLEEDAKISGTLEPLAQPQPRWSVAIVPIILLVFLIPGVAYGIATGSVRRPHDVSRALFDSVASMAPLIAMAFFAAQFLECFRYSRLDAMLANAGGAALVSAGLPPMVLLVALVAFTMTVNLMMSSMSAKWTVLAPILVPMLMMVGISPELTQATYRVGDSCTNSVTPLNVYLLVVLVTAQKWHKSLGLGNIIATMVPYSATFAVVWTVLLLTWVWLGLPLGPGAGLWYVPR